jgi:hypothetical protein
MLGAVSNMLLTVAVPVVRTASPARSQEDGGDTVNLTVTVTAADDQPVTGMLTKLAYATLLHTTDNFQFFDGRLRTYVVIICLKQKMVRSRRRKSNRNRSQRSSQTAIVPAALRPPQPTSTRGLNACKTSFISLSTTWDLSYLLPSSSFLTSYPWLSASMACQP